MRSMIRGALLVGLMLWLSGCSLTEQAVQDEQQVSRFTFNEGQHYTVLETPLPDVAPVTKFFYFGCRSCYQMIPVLSEWSKETGHHIALVPAHTDTRLVEGARLFHTFVEIGVLDKMYDLGYVIFQTEKSQLYGKERIDDFLNRHDVDTQSFWAAWGGEAVNRRLVNSLQLTRMAGVVNTPTFVVSGRYRVETGSITSVEELLALLTYLVDKKA